MKRGKQASSLSEVVRVSNLILVVVTERGECVNTSSSKSRQHT